MKTLIAFLSLILTATLGFGQATFRGTFIGNGAAVSNLDYAHITTPTTNGAYDVTKLFVHPTDLTGATDGLGNPVDMSTATNKTYHLIQTSPTLIWSNDIHVFVFWATNDFSLSGAGWVCYTNLNVSADDWLVSYLAIGGLGTNGDAVGAGLWIDGNGPPGYPNLFQFGTNNSVTYPQRNLLADGTNATTFLTMPNGNGLRLTNDVTVNSGLALELNNGVGVSSIIFGQTNGTPVGSDFGHLQANPGHVGSDPKNPSNSEIALYGAQMALVFSTSLQIGGGIGSAGNAVYQYGQRVGYVPFVDSQTNHSVPILFRTGETLGVGGPVQTHYGGIYEASVSTNAPGSYYLALCAHQSKGFDAEDGTLFFPSRTNESVRVWGGASNTVEVLQAAQFDGNVQVSGTISGNGGGLTSIPSTALPAPFTSGLFYNGTTNIGNLATTLVIQIGHTMPNTSYTPAISFLGASAVVPFFTSLTTTTFTLNLSAGITGGDNIAWSVIYSP